MEKILDYTNSTKNLDNNLNGWTFDFNKVFNSAFNLTNKQIGVQIGFTVLTLLITIVVGIVPIVGPLISALFLGTCLAVGFATGNYTFEKTSVINFNSYWDGFKFIGPITIWGLIKIAISVLLVGVLALFFLGGEDAKQIFQMFTNKEAMMENPEEIVNFYKSKLLPISLITLILTILAFPLIFIGHFIVFFKTTAVQSIQYSYKLCFKNYLGLLGAYILITLLFLIGSVITCGLGMLYFFPVMNNATYEMFKQMTSLGESEETETELIDTQI